MEFWLFLILLALIWIGLKLERIASDSRWMQERAEQADINKAVDRMDD